MRVARLLIGIVLAVSLMGVAASSAAAKSDRNHDRIPDRWEKKHGLSLKVNQARRDQDRDGLKNLGEFRARTDPRDDDSDNDGVEDGDEDRDHDGVDNANELREHTSPTVRDSDHDGKGDGREDADRDDLNNRGEDRTGNDPVDKDTDDDGTEDGDENAGKVESFDPSTGILTISGPDGTVSGKVTDATEISCNTEDEDENENEGEGDNNDGDHHDAGEASGSEDGEGDGPKGSGNELDDEDEVGDEDNHCTTADLKPDTAVHEAEGKVLNGTLVFTEIELVK
jgi:hypothetical protein